MTWIVLTGPHGAGKTTVGTALAGRLGVRFDEEIGRVLRERALAADPGASAWRPDPAFDAAVFEAERARDEARAAERLRVIETWHIGNLAYAEQRSPEVADAMRGYLSGAAPRDRVIVVPVIASDDVLRRRANEPGAASDAAQSFFRRVAARSVVIAQECGCVVATPLCTDAASPDALAARVEAAVAALSDGAGTRR